MKVVYPGSFDPITNGHVDIIKRASKIFGCVYVAVLCNATKKSLFSVDERICMIKCSLKGMSNIKIESFDGLLASYVEKREFDAVIRGLRNSRDFEYEYDMFCYNRELSSSVETIYFASDGKYSHLSSSGIKQVYAFGAQMEGMVPDCVNKALIEKFKVKKQ